MPATLDTLEVWLKALADQSRETNKLLEEIAEGASPSAPTPAPVVPTFAERITGAMDRVTKAAMVTQAGLLAFASTFDKVLASLGGAMTKFVQLANPGAVNRFNIALENAMSAVGRILLPSLQRLTLIVQQLGNAIESLSPEAKRLVGGLAMGGGLAGALSALATAGVLVFRALGGPITLLITLASVVAGVAAQTASGKAIMEAFGRVMKSFGSVVEVLARTLLPIIEVSLVPALETLAMTLDTVAETTLRVVNDLRSLQGQDPIQYDPNKNTAMAVRQGQFGDLRGLANRAYTSAFNSQAASIAEKHYDESKKQTGYLATIANWFGGIGRGFGKDWEGRDMSARSVFGRGGKAVGGDTGESVGRAAGVGLDWALEPSIMPIRALGRMAGVLT